MSPDGRPGVVLVRHGETAWSRSGQHTGRTDVPLSDAGRVEAVAVGRALAGRRFGLVLSSPFSRALDTARSAGFGDRLEVDADLAEWDYGVYEGRTTAEIRTEAPGWTVWGGEVPGGETAAQVAARADRVIGRAVAGGTGRTGDVLLFAHGHLLRVLAARWLGLDPSAGRYFALAPASISVLGWEREQAVLTSWNERAPGGE